MKAGATFFGGPLGGIASSLIGSAVDGKQQKNAQNRANAYNSPVNQRALAEAAGINPLVTIGKGTGLQNGNNFQPTFGQAFHNAVTQMRGDNIDQEAIDIERSKLELEKQKFQEYRTRTIRPKRAGLYGVEAENHAVNEADPRFLRVPHVGKNGQSLPLNLGPEWDELLTGSVLAGVTNVKAAKAKRDNERLMNAHLPSGFSLHRSKVFALQDRPALANFSPKALARRKMVLKANEYVKDWKGRKPLYSNSSRARSRRSYRPQISN